MEKTFSLEQIDKIADEIIQTIEQTGSHVIAFYGKMGSGKTTLIKAICARLGVVDIVQSPTFAIINQYMTESGTSIYHFDFYRLNNINDAINLGIEDYFYSGDLCLIEWPEIVEPLLPFDTIKFLIKIINKTKRKIIKNGA